MTPLESLEDLRNYLDFIKTESFSKTNLIRYFNEKFDIIETALNEYEWFEDTLKDFDVEKNQLRTALLFYKNFPKYEQELKALEIIKREPVETISDVLSFKDFDAMFRHYRNSGEFPYIKTETEFNLLREVLLCGL